MKAPASSLFTIVLIALFCQSCLKSPTPAFSYEPVENPEAGETIKFINESLDANKFYWEYGNGQSSEEEAGSTIYRKPGNFRVTLTAEKGSRSESITESILIYAPTILELYAYNNEGEPLEYADVEVFNSYNDASNRINFVGTSDTDKNGYAKFENLDAQAYYVVTYKGAYNGYWLSAGSVGPLRQNEINIYYTFAPFYPDGKKKSMELNVYHQKDSK